MTLTFIRLHFNSGQECWLNPARIEAVMMRADQQGEPVGSRIRTDNGITYEVAQEPSEVFELMDRLRDKE